MFYYLFKIESFDLTLLFKGMYVDMFTYIYSEICVFGDVYTYHSGMTIPRNIAEKYEPEMKI
jgi:hypothetical protein